MGAAEISDPVTSKAEVHVSNKPWEGAHHVNDGRGLEDKDANAMTAAG